MQNDCHILEFDDNAYPYPSKIRGGGVKKYAWESSCGQSPVIEYSICLPFYQSLLIILTEYKGSTIVFNRLITIVRLVALDFANTNVTLVIFVKTRRFCSNIWYTFCVKVSHTIGHCETTHDNANLPCRKALNNYCSFELQGELFPE